LEKEDKVSNEENNFLTAPFLESEIKEAILVVMLRELLAQMGCLFSFIRNFGMSLRMI
jgi:hypothetical protein